MIDTIRHLHPRSTSPPFFLPLLLAIPDLVHAQTADSNIATKNARSASNQAPTLPAVKVTGNRDDDGSGLGDILQANSAR